MKQETVTTIEEAELNALIEKEFGRPFRFTRDQETGDGSYREFSLSKIGCIGYQTQMVNDFIAGSKKEGWLADALLQALCFQGKLPEGRLLVRSEDYT